MKYIPSYYITCDLKGLSADSCLTNITLRKLEYRQ